MHIESTRNVLACASVSNNKVDDRRRYPSSAPASIAPPNSASQVSIIIIIYKCSLSNLIFYFCLGIVRHP